MAGLLRSVAQRPGFRAWARSIAHWTASLSRSLDTPRDTLLAIAELARRHGGDRPAVSQAAALTAFELRVFSQNGEDGVLLELLCRAGDGGRWFVEFGAGDGHENNCAFLADVLAWEGLFMEADPASAARLQDKYRGTRVRTQCAVVGAGTVDSLLSEAGAPEELDVLSIDVDGPDYAIWQALERHTARIVVIEYDASLGRQEHRVRPEGASIQALRALGEAKGYRLVHTELTGNNAFFVRADQPGTYPEADAVPLRTANHYLAGEGYIPRSSNGVSSP